MDDIKPVIRFNRLAWGGVNDSRPQGVIAAGMENGELALWDPVKILAGARYVVLQRVAAHMLYEHITLQCISVPHSSEYYTYGSYTWT